MFSKVSEPGPDEFDAVRNAVAYAGLSASVQMATPVGAEVILPHRYIFKAMIACAGWKRIS